MFLRLGLDTFCCCYKSIRDIKEIDDPNIQKSNIQKVKFHVEAEMQIN